MDHVGHVGHALRHGMASSLPLTKGEKMRLPRIDDRRWVSDAAVFVRALRSTRLQ
jgi:hypothetical protein